MDYLGHVISVEGVANEKKNEVITSWPQPNNLKALGISRPCRLLQEVREAVLGDCRAAQLIVEEESIWLVTGPHKLLRDSRKP